MAILTHYAPTRIASSLLLHFYLLYMVLRPARGGDKAGGQK